LQPNFKLKLNFIKIQDNCVFSEGTTYNLQVQGGDADFVVRYVLDLSTQ